MLPPPTATAFKNPYGVVVSLFIMLLFNSDILPLVVVSQYISNFDSNGLVSKAEKIGFIAVSRKSGRFRG